MAAHKSSRLNKVQQAADFRSAAQSVIEAGLWFIDVPRTSSTSIRVELAEQFGSALGKSKIIEAGHATGNVFLGHPPARKMRRMLGAPAWTALYTFTFVRNPWDRILSMFHYRRKAGNLPAEWSFGEYVDRLVDAERTTPHFQFHGFRFGAADFITNRQGKVIVDDVFRFEDRAGGLARIAEATGVVISGETRLQSAKPPGQTYREMHDDRRRELVAARYALDIDLFGYAF